METADATLELSSSDRRRRVRQVLEQRKLGDNASPDEAQRAWEQDRFVARARALFYARLMFLMLGLLILSIPAWSSYFGLSGPVSFAGYFVMLMYSVANFMVIDHPRVGRWTTYLTLCFDVAISVILIAKPQIGGGMRSPLLATQLLFTMLFALLFPKPLAILPALLALPLLVRLDQLLDRESTALAVLTVLWYSALNVIVVYVLVYMNEREAAAHRDVVTLQGDLKELAIVEERNRLAREIHDGLGASLSSLIIQSEYLLQLAKDEPLRQEIQELKNSAEESIEELRRSLRMMREDFELGSGLEEYVRTFSERTQMKTTFSRGGQTERLSPDAQLTLFRILQECLSNAAKHAGAKEVAVRLEFDGGHVLLSIHDDGRGFDPTHTPPGHYGLRNMHERAAKMNGQLVIDSAPGQGARFSFRLPLDGRSS